MRHLAYHIHLHSDPSGPLLGRGPFGLVYNVRRHVLGPTCLLGLVLGVAVNMASDVFDQ